MGRLGLRSALRLDDSQPASPTEPEYRSLAGLLSLAEFPPSAGPPSAGAAPANGGRPETRLQAVTRIQRPHAPGWNPRDPVTPSAAGRAEFDLSGVPAGEHQLSLIAWAPDASAKPVSVHLPRITIRGA